MLRRTLLKALAAVVTLPFAFLRAKRVSAEPQSHPEIKNMLRGTAEQLDFSDYPMTVDRDKMVVPTLPPDGPFIVTAKHERDQDKANTLQDIMNHEWSKPEFRKNFWEHYRSGVRSALGIRSASGFSKADCIGGPHA